MKTSIKTLKNGLKLILVEDKTKNATTAELIVKYGSAVRNINVDGEDYEIKPGLAHLLEHTMIEDSMYGNVSKFFRDNYVYFNGFTSESLTYFPIETVKDFKKYLKVLIEYVNKVSFTEEKLEEIKKPVIDEIIRSKDRSYYKYNQVFTKVIHNKDHFESTLGKEEDVLKITTKDLMFVHDAFYQPDNEILSISGNFDTDDIIKYIEEIYDNLNIQKKEVTILDLCNDTKIDEKEITFEDNDFDSLASIVYKFDLTGFSNIDLLKLDYYASFFMDYYFSETSLIQKEIFKNKLSSFSINSKKVFINKRNYCFSCFGVSLITTEFDAFFNLVDNTLKEEFNDKEYFELWKRQSLIGIIRRDKIHSFIRRNLTNNILNFDIEENEGLDFVENLSFEEYKEFMSRLDFNNKVYIRQTKSVNE